MNGLKHSFLLAASVFLAMGMHGFCQEGNITDAFEWLSGLGTVSLQSGEKGFHLSIQDKPDPEGRELYKKDWNTIEDRSITGLSFYKIHFTSNDLSLVRNFTGLKTLWISYGNFSDAHFKTIGSMDTLTRLALKETDIDDAGLEYLGYFKNLEALELRQAHLAGSGLEHLEKLTKLKQITVTCSGEMNQHLFHLQKLALLEDVSLFGRTTPSGWRYLKDISTLRRISCRGADITDEILGILSEYKNWRTLDIWHSAYVSYSMKIKTHFSLRPTRVTGKGLKYLSGLGLKDLVLPKEFSDEDMDHLQDIKDIHTLEVLELSDKNTKDCLEKLYFLKHLKKLKINKQIKKQDLAAIHNKNPALAFSWSFNLD